MGKTDKHHLSKLDLDFSSFDEGLDRQYDWSQFQPPVPQSLFDEVRSEMLYLRLLLLDLSEWL